jgi:hypothetical protein
MPKIYLEPSEADMEFRLTYAGQLLAHRDDKRLLERSHHVHGIRKEFHLQLAKLWTDHPVLAHEEFNKSGVVGASPIGDFMHDEFRWRPIVNERNGLVCALDILMLRDGPPGKALQDIDNRLKTIFDALRKAKGPSELGAGTPRGQQRPEPHENPFFVLLEDDRLITHVSVTTDTLLEPVPNVPPNEAVRLVINVTVRPYHVHMDNLAFS